MSANSRSRALSVFSIAACLGLAATPGCGPGPVESSAAGGAASTTSAGGDTSVNSGGSGGETSTTTAGGGGATTTSAGGSGGAGGDTSTGGSGGVGGAPPAPGDILWMKMFGTPKSDLGSTLDFDAAGDMLVGGAGGGPINFGGGALPESPQGGSWAFLAKLDGSGNHIWSKRFGATNGQELELTGIQCAKLLDDGGVLVGGYYEGTLQLGTKMMTSVGLDDNFVMRLDANGNVLWSKTFGTPDHDNFYCEADPQGNMVLGGGFEDQIDFGAGPLFADPGLWTPYVVKLDGDGNPMWEQLLSNPAGDTRMPHPAIDAAGNVLIAGRFKGQLTLGGQDLISPNALQPYAIKLGPGGDVVWATSPPAPIDFNAFFVVDVAADPAGDLLVTARDVHDGFTILRIDASGNLVWTLINPPQPFDAWDMDTDSEGNMLLTGQEYDPAAVKFYIIVEKRAPSGEILWRKRWYTTQPPGAGLRVVADPQDNVVLLGDAGKITEIDGGMILNGQGGADVLLGRFAK